jgi:hypothetical protein
LDHLARPSGTTRTRSSRPGKRPLMRQPRRPRRPSPPRQEVRRVRGGHRRHGPGRLGGAV